MNEITIKDLMNESFNILKKLVELDEPLSINECSKYLNDLSHNQTLNLSYFMSLTKMPIPSSDRLSEELQKKFTSLPEIKEIIVTQTEDTPKEMLDDDPHWMMIMQIMRIMASLSTLSSTLDSVIDKECCETHRKIKQATEDILKSIDLDSIKDRMAFIVEEIKNYEMVH